MGAEMQILRYLRNAIALAAIFSNEAYAQDTHKMANFALNGFEEVTRPRMRIAFSYAPSDSSISSIMITYMTDIGYRSEAVSIGENFHSISVWIANCKTIHYFIAGGHPNGGVNQGFAPKQQAIEYCNDYAQSVKFEISSSEKHISADGSTYYYIVSSNKGQILDKYYFDSAGIILKIETTFLGKLVAESFFSKDSSFTNEEIMSLPSNNSYGLISDSIKEYLPYVNSESAKRNAEEVQLREGNERIASENRSRQVSNIAQAMQHFVDEQRAQAAAEQSRRQDALRRKQIESQLQAQREQTAAYERQQAANRQAADQRAFEDRRFAAQQAEQQRQQQLAQQRVEEQQPALSGTSGPQGYAGGTSNAGAQATAERQRQLQEQQRQQQQAAKANPNFRHRIERTQNGYAIYVTNPNSFDIQCQVRIDAYRWVGTSQQNFSESSPIYVSAGRENYVGWDRLQPVGANYSVGGCRGI